MTRRKRRSKLIPSELLVHKVSEFALSKKAGDIHILDVRQQTTITDFFIICSGSTDIHVEAILDAILEGLEPETKPWHVEGRGAFYWVLIDYVDVVVHIFQQEARDFYQLERLWADAEMEVIEDKPEALSNNTSNN